MLGGIIALGAIGLTLCYGVLKFPNFAHGALVTIGAYAAFALVSLFPQGPPLRPFSFGWELIASMFLAATVVAIVALVVDRVRSEEHTSELQSLMRISYAVFRLKKQIPQYQNLDPHIL